MGCLLFWDRFISIPLTFSGRRASSLWLHYICQVAVNYVKGRRWEKISGKGTKQCRQLHSGQAIALGISTRLVG